MKNSLQKILIVDDDMDMCFLLNHFLTRKGYVVVEKYTGASALKYLETEQPDLIVCDFNLDDTDGITLLNTVKSLYEDLPVIIITGFSDNATSDRALKQGAFKYVLKPLSPEEILVIIQSALSEKEKDEKGLKENKAIHTEFDQLFFNTKSLKQILKQVNLVSPSAYNVIIYGEKGSGKKTIAYEIHKRSRRRDMSFVSIDSIEFAEKFEKNAELVNGGTLFIKQVEKLSDDSQKLLLNLIKDKRIKSKSGFKDVDVRVLCSTSQSLWEAVHHAGFREDLYQALNDFNISMPSLRDHKEDILPFAFHFMRIINTQLHKNVKSFSAQAEIFFKNYRWNNNLQELKSMIHIAVLLTTTEYIDVNVLPLTSYDNLLTAGTPGKVAQQKML